MAIDWTKIESLMLKSFTGGGLTETEQALVKKAYESNPTEYGERHRRIKNEEIEKRRQFK